MGTYLPNSTMEQREMLDYLGLESLDDLYSHLPDAVRLNRELDIPKGKSELEVHRMMTEMAAKNKVFRTIFRGAGAYNHYIPSIVKATISKEAFVTAYTPYQPEISQGILQSIFEYQTMICELTGLDAANASVYDGATACAEAVAMCIDRKREKAYISATLHPDYQRTVKTYCYAAGRDVVVVPEKGGVTDIDFLRTEMTSDSACFIMQQPNYYGLIEDADALGEVTKNAGAKFVVCVNPIYAAIGKPPGECGADIAVGEGQPLGISLGFGGPYLGFMAAKKEMTRKLPGRVVGQTVDEDGKRAFVLTMQAREQHIRREKALSSICSNQALCAMAAACYMGAMGPAGLADVASQCMSKEHYAAGLISGIAGFERVHDGEFFHEFVTKCPGDPESIMAKLEDRGILGGHILRGQNTDGNARSGNAQSGHSPGVCGDSHILWCCTEMNTKDEIDELVSILREGVAE